MALILPGTYHKIAEVERNRISWIEPEQAERQDIRPLRIGILNIMPLGKQYEFNLRDFVVTARKDQRHGSWDVIQLRTARACSKSALMSSMCSRPTETRTIVGVTPAEACSASLSCWWVVDAG